MLTPTIAEDGKEEEEYEDWMNRNRGIRESMVDLPGESNEDRLP